MGLDMYLSKKIYIGAQYEHNNVKGEINIEKEGKPIKINFNKVSYIEESTAYWRKANHIHKWFVDNVQNGVDDCGDYDVSIDQLKELVSTCKKVIETAKTVDGQILYSETWDSEGHHYNYKDGLVISNQEEIAEILPTTRGFFFGSDDYDQYYL